MNILRDIKLFFTDSDFRWVCKESLWLWFLSRKPVIYIISWIIAFHFKRKSKNMSRWEKYQLQMEYENSTLKWSFYAQIYNLVLILGARGTEKNNPQEFEANRNDMLQSELIDYPEYAEIKKWLEINENLDTADLQTLVNIYDSMMAKY